MSSNPSGASGMTSIMITPITVIQQQGKRGQVAAAVYIPWFYTTPETWGWVLLPLIPSLPLLLNWRGGEGEGKERLIAGVLTPWALEQWVSARPHTNQLMSSELKAHSELLAGPALTCRWVQKAHCTCSAQPRGHNCAATPGESYHVCNPQLCTSLKRSSIFRAIHLVLVISTAFGEGFFSSLDTVTFGYCCQKQFLDVACAAFIYQSTSVLYFQEGDQIWTAKDLHKLCRRNACDE